MYEELFRQRAVKDFELRAKDYLPSHGSTIEAILEGIQTISREAMDDNTYKKGLKELMRRYRLYLATFANPSTLTKDEELALPWARVWLLQIQKGAI
jgi:hypothetical protein